MARAKGFDEEKALSGAMRLFWSKGYTAASLQDLEEAMGLGRTSIYNAFGNKRALFKLCLALYARQIEAKLTAIVANSSSSREAAEQCFAAVINMLVDPETPAGCLVVFSVLEGEQHDQEAKNMAGELFAKQRAVLLAILQQGVARGEFSPELDCAGVAEALTAAISGLVVLAVAGFTEGQLRGIARATLRLLD